MTKSRTLYQVRNHPDGYTFGQTVGHKCRLLPRNVASRIAKRLRRSGLDVLIAPVLVNVTPLQAAYLARRYG